MLTCRFADGGEIELASFPLARALAGAKTMRAEAIVISVPDGGSVRALINVTPIRAGDGENGEVVSVVVTMQDLAPLEELERQRTEFLGMVSHELRAPLAAIKGSADTALEEAADLDPAEMREFFRIIAEQAAHMRGLVGALLDAGRIEAGTLSVTPEPCDVAALVDRARTTFLSGGGRHPVLVDLAPALPPAMADRRRVVQVLSNLLSNAARHSPESSPIRIAAACDGVQVAVSVSDEGRGIAPARLAQLFRKYAGRGGAGERAHAGTGLGLLICKGLVEAHGGRIRAESEGPGRGARFTFTLPAVAHIGEREAARARPRAGAPPEPTPILVVDDDPNTLRYVRDILTAEGYAPVVTGDHEALSGLIRAERPALVLLDLMLAGTDGLALLHATPELAELPVVFISAYGRDETVAKALRAGAADYVVKPFSPTELTARIEAALRRVARPEPFALGALAIDYEARRVTVAGRAVALTTTEYDILRMLSHNAGRVVSYEALLRQVWKGRKADDSNLVLNFVKKLRAKLGEDAAHPTWIFNLRGVGYRIPRPGAPPEP